MIKQIIKYETSDKREFASLQEAEKYERRFKYLIGRKEGLQFALDKAKGILPL